MKKSGHKPKVLVLGVGPLPHSSTDRLHAPGMRVWSLAQQCAVSNFQVVLGCIGFSATETAVTSSRETISRHEDIIIHELPGEQNAMDQAIQRLCLTYNVRAVVSNSDLMNAASARIPRVLNRWMDYNGDPFAEKQLQAFTYQHDGSLKLQWNLYLQGLASANQFSVCSLWQKHALIGQLAFSGRLDGRDAGTDYVHVMPNSSRFMGAVSGIDFQLKGNIVPDRSRVVLWSGGFNTWSDPECLAQALKIVLSHTSNVYFVSTGGKIDGHDNRSFERFQASVSEMGIDDKIVFLGWRPTAEIPSIYRQSDVALNVDKWSVEGELGTRTRLVDWIQFELPVITTSTCEFARELSAQKLVSEFQPGAPESLAEAILEVLSDPTSARNKATRAAEYLESYYSEETCYRPLRQWLSQLPAAKSVEQSRLLALHLETVS